MDVPNFLIIPQHFKLSLGVPWFSLAVEVPSKSWSRDVVKFGRFLTNARFRLFNVHCILVRLVKVNYNILTPLKLTKQS